MMLLLLLLLVVLMMWVLVQVHPACSSGEPQWAFWGVVQPLQALPHVHVPLHFGALPFLRNLSL
jgi:hypothetical protein